MRRFRSSRTNLKDARIAYTYLIILAMVLAVMGLVVTQLKTQLGINELIGYRDTLAECSDSLRGFTASIQPERKLSAALRFENAAAALTCTDKTRGELLRFAEILRKSVSGEAPAPDNASIRALSDTFSVLASLDYKNSESAREHIIGVLDYDIITRIIGGEKLADENSLKIDDTELSTQPASGKLEQYAYLKASGFAEKLLGNTIKMLTIERSDIGYTARADNLRAEFSNYDGGAESLLHIRLGKTPEVYFTENELAAYAKNLITGTLSLNDSSIVTTRLETFCGFTTVEFEAGSDKIVTVLDSHGRLWVLEKVKR